MEFGNGIGAFGNQDESVFSRDISPTTFNVDAALGNDAWDGSFEQPFRTIQRAIDAADEMYNPGGDIINVRPGTYYENLTIHDDDWLKIFGVGESPHDVVINGSKGAGMDTAYIGGGSDVRFFNLAITGAEYHGINAYQVGYVFLKNVDVFGNGMSGYNGMDVDRTKIYHSQFEQNGAWGASVWNGSQFRSVDSHFHWNGDGGLTSNYIDDTSLVGVSASWNQATGFDGYGNTHLKVVNSSFDQNQGYGLRAFHGWDVSISNVHAHQNLDSGAYLTFQNTASAFGGNFSHNGGQGVIFSGVSDKGPATNPILNAYGTIGDANGDSGIVAYNLEQANFFGVFGRHNQYTGLYINSVFDAKIYGATTNANETGVELTEVESVLAVDGLSVHNEYDGLYQYGGNRLNVIGGYYGHNSGWGIYAYGRYNDYLQRVDVKSATVENNAGGIYVGQADLSKIVGGSASHNHSDGIYLANTIHGIFDHTFVAYNQGYGVNIIAGLSEGFPGAAGGDQPYLWNQFDFTGGLYKSNDMDGIHIGTYYSYVDTLNVNAHAVVARNNGGRGLNIGGQGVFEEGGGGPGSDANLFLNMQGGYYAYNDSDGIYLLGVITDPPNQSDFGSLAAQVVDVVAEYNGGYGLTGSGRVNHNSEYGFTAVAGHPWYYSLLNFQRGFFGFNHESGINLTVAGGMGGNEPTLAPQEDGNDDPHSHYRLATFDNVLAIGNEGHGVNFNTIRMGHSPDDPVEAAGDHHSVSLAHFWRGVFNLNQYSGINLNAVSNNDRSLAGHHFERGFELEHVIANANGWNGLTIESDSFRPDVSIIGGAFNVNQADGIHLAGLRHVDISLAHAISNGDDGIEGTDLQSINLESVLAAGNGDQDIDV